MNRARPYLNRFVKIKEQEIEDTYHTANLRDIRPITTKLMDHTETIVINRSKGDMLREVRELQIERENKVLLQKISSVMSKKGSYSVSKTKNYRTRVNKSLNQFYRKKQLDEISLQNKRFVQRLQDKKPTLNLAKLNKEWLSNQQVIKRMANHDFNLTSIKSGSRVRSITIDRFRSKYDKVKIKRNRVIGGNNMLITLEFTDEVLKIIGDFQNHKKVEIIQIPRQEAIQFIEKECKGKIEKIIDRLEYDPKTKTLIFDCECLEEEEPDFGDVNPEVHFKNIKSSLRKNHYQKNSIQSKQNTTPLKETKRQEGKRDKKNSQESQVEKIKSENEEHKQVVTHSKEKIEFVQEDKKKGDLIEEKQKQQSQKLKSTEDNKDSLGQVLLKQGPKATGEDKPEHVVEKLDEQAVNPQPTTYEEEKFQESNPVQESKPEQVKHKDAVDIVVAPEEEENYIEQIEGAEVNNS